MKQSSAFSIVQESGGPALKHMRFLFRKKNGNISSSRFVNRSQWMCAHSTDALQKFHSYAKLKYDRNKLVGIVKVNLESLCAAYIS